MSLQTSQTMPESPRTVSANEAKDRLGALMRWVTENQQEVIIKKHGEPLVVILSISQYEEAKKAQEENQQNDALARLEKLTQRIEGKNKDLTQEEADKLADRYVRDVIDDMVKEGKITFKGS